MLKIPTSPNYKDDDAVGDYGPCVVCGRDIKGKNPSFVHVHGGGMYAVTEEEAEGMNPQADCGFQPVGPDCLRKHPELKSYSQTAKELTTWGEDGNFDDFDKLY